MTIAHCLAKAAHYRAALARTPDTDEWWLKRCLLRREAHYFLAAARRIRGERQDD